MCATSQKAFPSHRHDHHITATLPTGGFTVPLGAMVTNWHESYLSKEHPLQYYCCSKNITVVNIELWQAYTVIFLLQSHHKEAVNPGREKYLWYALSLACVLSLCATSRTSSSTAIICCVYRIIRCHSSFYSWYNTSCTAGKGRSRYIISLTSCVCLVFSRTQRVTTWRPDSKVLSDCN